MDALWMVLALAVCAAMWYIGSRIEPHYVSKDGHRFLCTGRWISAYGEPEGRKREVRIMVLGTGQLQMEAKRGFRRGLATMWSIEGKAAQPPRRRVVYVLRANLADGTHRMTIQLPSNSRAVPVLDEALANAR